MAKVQVTVALTDAADTPRVLRELQARGLEITDSDAELGFVAGHCEEAGLDQLRGIAGVASVERARRFQLPPDPSAPQ